MMNQSWAVTCAGTYTGPNNGWVITLRVWDEREGQRTLADMLVGGTITSVEEETLLQLVEDLVASRCRNEIGIQHILEVG